MKAHFQLLHTAIGRLMLAFLLAVCLGRLPAYALIGETVAQCDACYGTPKRVGHDAPLSTQTRTYAKGELIIVVGFNNEGTVESVTYSKVLGVELSKEEQEGFLAENKDDSTWSPMKSASDDQSLWSRADGRGLASYMSPSHWLVVITKAYYEKSLAALLKKGR